MNCMTESGSAKSHVDSLNEPHAPPPRRGVLVKLLALVVGGITAICPFAAGLAVFVDPLMRRHNTWDDPSKEDDDFVEVADLDIIPADGQAIRCSVISDRRDAWTLERQVPIGAVYLRRIGSEVQALNVICPHAGCFVGYTPGEEEFKCPCHTSSFTLDGKRIEPTPSPRDMDRLEVRVTDGKVSIKFQNFYTGKHEQKPKQ